MKKPALNKILNQLKGKSKINWTSWFVERKLIPNGIGALSASRLLRKLRQQGIIHYPDPRSTNHIYKISINKKNLKKLIK